MPSVIRLYVGESPHMDAAHRITALNDVVQSMEYLFGGVTIYAGVGRYAGESENTTIIESLSGLSAESAAAVVRPVATSGARALDQESILMTSQEVGVSELVEGRV